MKYRSPEDAVSFLVGDFAVRQVVPRYAFVAPPRPQAGEKRCYTCRAVKSEAEFYRRSYGRKGCMPNCKECHIKAVQRNSYHNI